MMPLSATCGTTGTAGCHPQNRGMDQAVSSTNPEESEMDSCLVAASAHKCCCVGWGAAGTARCHPQSRWAECGFAETLHAREGSRHRKTATTMVLSYLRRERHCIRELLHARHKFVSALLVYIGFRTPHCYSG